LKALADATRWQIVCELLASSMTVGDLAQRLHVSHYNASKHVRILREAGLVKTARTGRHVRCQIAPELRKQLRRGNNQLDLGCCTFRFTRARSK
jgi:DNA-binding transcriptional ArsR family regulator